MIFVAGILVDYYINNTPKILLVVKELNIVRKGEKEI